MYLVEHDLLQEVQPDVVGRRTLAEPGIVVLAAKEFNIVVALVKMEIQIAAALRAFQQAGEYAGLLRDRGLFAARPFLERLHLFPSLAVNDSLMDIEEDRPVLLRVLNPALHFIGFGIAFKVDDIATVFLRGQNLLDCGVPPFCGLHGAFGAASACTPAAPVVGRVDDPIRTEGSGSFSQPVPVQRHAVDTAYHLGGLRINHPKARVVRVFDVAIGRRGERNPGVAFHLIDDPALLGNVLGVVFIEQRLFGKGKDKQAEIQYSCGFAAGWLPKS